MRVWRPDNTSVDYRGLVYGLPAGNGAVTNVSTVLVLPIESYLWGVVPRESPASWPAAALQAQSVAARTYALSAMRRNAAQPYDICDTTACQVFGGTTEYSSTGGTTAREDTRSTAAVTATNGIVLTYQGAVAFTEFSSSNGGWSTASSQGYPYLRAQSDPWDGTAPGDPVHSWTATLSASAVEAKFPSIGSLQRMVVTSRDGNGQWGGRVTGVRLEGSAGTVNTTGAAITSAGGLRSSWWTIDDHPPVGSFDGTTYAGGSTVRMGGWALDPDSPDPITVHVTVDGALVAAATANTSRPDVGAAYPGYGNNHGFDIPATVGGGSHQVCTHALNTGSAGVYSQPISCRVLNMSGPLAPGMLTGGSPLVLSPSGTFWLSMQPDGNLVVYDQSGKPRWATMTNVPGSVLRVQEDGNVVVYDPQWEPLWATGNNRPGAVLKMQDDGNLVLYSGSGGALWDSAGYTHRSGTYFMGKSPVPSLGSGASARSYNGRYEVAMQSDGNLVVYDSSHNAQWATMTGYRGSYMTVQGDGNVVVYSAPDRPVWHAALYSPGDRLVLQDDGNLVVYDAGGKPIWDSYGFTGHAGVRLS